MGGVSHSDEEERLSTTAIGERTEIEERLREIQAKIDTLAPRFQGKRLVQNGKNREVTELEREKDALIDRILAMR
jgi:hypothetical protein